MEGNYIFPQKKSAASSLLCRFFFESKSNLIRIANTLKSMDIYTKRLDRKQEGRGRALFKPSSSALEYLMKRRMEFIFGYSGEWKRFGID